VQTVVTEVRNTASQDLLAKEIKIHKTAEDENGDITESHFEAKLELDDSQEKIESEKENGDSVPKLARDEL
jgi:hypothetical protein